jgi:sulfonate transport system permease protein
VSMRGAKISLVATAVGGLAIWQLVYAVGGMGGRLPSLWDVTRIFFRPEFLGDLGAAFLHTFLMLFQCLVLGTIAGYVLGVVIGAWPSQMHGPYHVANALRSVPVTVLLPVFLSTFGLRRFLLPMLLLPIICIMASNVSESVRNTSKQRRALLDVYRVRWRQYFAHVLTYETIEPVVATLRVVAPLALAIEIAVDYFLQSNQGLGTLIALAYQIPGREPRMFAGILVVAALGVLLVIAVDSIGTRALRWKRDM